jgi:hypothetical protein
MSNEILEALKQLTDVMRDVAHTLESIDTRIDDLVFTSKQSKEVLEEINASLPSTPRSG